MGLPKLKNLKVLFTPRKALYLAKLKGWFGRRAQVEALIPFGKAERDMTKAERSACMAQFHKKYPNCSEVQVHGLWTSRIGEFLPRCIAIAMDSAANTDNTVVHVFVPSGRECNSRLMKIMRRRFVIISPEDAAFWKTILIKSKGRLWKHYAKYSFRNNAVDIPPQVLDNLIVFNDEELAEAEEKMRAMELHQPYVCISSRDAAYLAKNEPERDFSYHDYRNSRIAACAKAAGYLEEQGIQTVRVGKYVAEKADFPSCIDFSRNYYDELLDIVLPKFSKFFVCDDSGIYLVPLIMGIPVAMKNVVILNAGNWGCLPQIDGGLFICKKLFLKAENRYLSIREMLELKARGGGVFYTEFYVENGIEVIENTEEEIYDLVKEMNERLDGTWVETEESIQMQERVQKILYDDIINSGLEYNLCWHCNISVNFLKRNPFLLE